MDQIMAKSACTPWVAFDIDRAEGVRRMRLFGMMLNFEIDIDMEIMKPAIASEFSGSPQDWMR